MILQLSPPLHMQTPKGPGWAHFVIDYGQEHHCIWGVARDADGAWWWVPNPEARLSPNWTMERRGSSGPCAKCPGEGWPTQCVLPGCPLKPMAPKADATECPLCTVGVRGGCVLGTSCPLSPVNSSAWPRR